MKRFLLLLTLVALVLGVVYVATDDGTLFPKSTEQPTSEPTPAPATKTTPAPKPVAKPTPAPAPAPAPNPDDAKHLAFKGVPITGTLQRYVESMKSAGFRLISGGNGMARMRGDFAGFKDCKLQVSTIDNHNLVCSIDVFFAEREQWSELHNDYTALKKMLTQKYGSPASCVEKFEGLIIQPPTWYECSDPTDVYIATRIVNHSMNKVSRGINNSIIAHRASQVAKGIASSASGGGRSGGGGFSGGGGGGGGGGRW